MYTDTLGNQLEIGNLVFAGLVSNAQPVLGVITGFPDLNKTAEYQYIDITYLTVSRHWKSKANGRFPHPQVRWRPNRKPGEYIFSITTKEEKILSTSFTVRVQEPFDIGEFARRHMGWWMRQLSPAHQTAQTPQDFVALIEAKLIELKNNGQ